MKLKPMLIVNEVNKRLNPIYPLALAASSTKESTDTVLMKMRSTKCLKMVLTRNSIQFPKPNPEIYKSMSSYLKTQPSETVVLENSENGFKAAKNVGIGCIAIPHSYTFTPRLRDIDFKFTNPGKLNQEFLMSIWN